jgi:flavodoxin
MKAIVIFDSHYGNTKMIADTIAKKLGDYVPHISIKDIKAADINEYDLLIIGSPNIGWKPTGKIDRFLISLNSEKLKSVNIAAFDTRVKTFITLNPSHKIVKTLQKYGTNIIVPPMGFYVKEKEAVLHDGELEKAENWATLIKSKF